MKKKTTPAVELTEAPASHVPVLTSNNKKLALSTRSSASESGPSTGGSAGNEELREGAGDFCFIMNTEALYLIAKTFQCCGSELEIRKDFSCITGLVAKISSSCNHWEVVTDPYRKEDVSANSRATLDMRKTGLHFRPSLESWGCCHKSVHKLTLSITRRYWKLQGNWYLSTLLLLLNFV